MSPREIALRTLAAAAGHRSLSALARAAHVDRLTLRLLLRGVRSPAPRTIERLARALRVSRGVVLAVLDEQGVQ